MMKMNAKSVMCVLCYILAIYGIIILIRKIMNRKEKNPEGKWSYYVEPYRGFGCKKCKECKDKACLNYFIEKAGGKDKLNANPVLFQQLKECMTNRGSVTPDSICNCSEDKDKICL